MSTASTSVWSCTAGTVDMSGQCRPTAERAAYEAHNLAGLRSQNTHTSSGVLKGTFFGGRWRRAITLHASWISASRRSTWSLPGAKSQDEWAKWRPASSIISVPRARAVSLASKTCPKVCAGEVIGAGSGELMNSSIREICEISVRSTVPTRIVFATGGRSSDWTASSFGVLLDGVPPV